MTAGYAKEIAEAGSDKKRRCKDTADRARTKSRSRSQHFAQQNHSDDLPGPLSRQNAARRAVAIAANFRVENSERADDCAARKHFKKHRHRETTCKLLAYVE